ncbi:uncharacterized protein TNCV_2012252 [Trichonephila clavipes]|nr:uncharacterized protein TNCV_2012252 [Trichonephila clavipes]
MRARNYYAHPNIRDHWALRCMNRSPDLVVCLKRDLQCLRPQASLVLIYRPNATGMKGRVDLAPPVNRTQTCVNQPNYARWCVKYLDNLNKVDETHPGLINDFINGCFGIKRTDKPFSRIPIDLTFVQTINAEASRRLSGIAHFTNSLAARQCWTINHSIRASCYNLSRSRCLWIEAITRRVCGFATK